MNWKKREIIRGDTRMERKIGRGGNNEGK
jgi:hypothetical protein